MRKQYTFILILFLLLLREHCFSQDLTFSQFYEQPLLRNPALAGIFTGDIRVSAAYRDQWASVTVPFRTTALSIEHKFPVGKANDNLTIGTQFTEDAAGDIRLKRTQLLPAINFHKSLSDEKDTYLSLAFMGGPTFSQFDPTQIKLGDQYQGGSYNPSNPTSQLIKYSGYSYWDLATGLCFSTTFNEETRFYIAAGYSHFTKPVIRSVTGNVENFLFPKLTFNVGINGPVSDRARMIAFADYFSQNGSRQLLGGFLYGIDVEKYYDEQPFTFYMGSFMRWGDALIPVIKMDFSHITLGISYDVNISKLKVVSNSRGGLELTASYTGFLKIRNSTLDKLRCVKF